MDGDDDRLDSDSREAPEFSFLTADTAGGKLKKSGSKSSARTSSLDKVSKRNRTSKKDALQAVYDEKLTKMENNFNVKLDRLFQLFTNSVDNDQSRESFALPGSDGHSVDNLPSGERRPPLVSLEPNLDQDLGSPHVSRNRDLDVRSEISISIGDRERNELDIHSDEDDYSVSGNSPVKGNTNQMSKGERFLKHVRNEQVQVQDLEQVKSDERQTTTNVLSQIFSEDLSKEKSSVGLILDQAQVNILESSWRCKIPEHLSAYKEEYKSCFPINDDSASFLQVPKLDDLLEPMIRQTHGQKLMRSWDNHRQLYSQPYKQIEKLGFQGQLASRMNIISLSYMQQALGSLLKDLEEDDVDKSTACQTVKDIFAMSTKSLDQAGRSGAFFHLIRRKAAAHDSGLSNIKDLSSRCQYLPLSEEGVFGKGLETSLEKRKEQKDQLSDLLPEFSKKRKFEDSRSSSNKSAKFSDQGARPTRFQNTSSGYNSSSYRKPVSTYNSYNNAKDKAAGSNRQEGNKKDFKVGKTTTKSSWGSFRIPKRNDS
ncbi:unnamed protein product [Mytilus edulis]|uniref:Uncharacterized protein n=1 Tax=Mytilus edulis TaxID=6550 RepID=A0A8S3Q166_MYTED|nr:unnamed protein product [Mytilus edulis]